MDIIRTTTMSAVFRYMNRAVAAGLADPAHAGPMMRLKKI